MSWRLTPEIARIIERALEEDIGSGDVSSTPLFDDDTMASAVIVAKASGVLAGLPVAEATFAALSPELEWQAQKQDGAALAPGESIATLNGRVRHILLGERVALNFLQRLSGIASMTRQFVDAVGGFDVKILDTRKTAPGLRVLDKYAVRVGGGFNHRFGLDDGVLIKDNHLRAAGGVAAAVARVRERSSPLLEIEVEVTSLVEVEEAIEAGADIIMLDNMSPDEMGAAVKTIGKRAFVEASGGVTLDNLKEIAASGVDWISIGALTHSVRALDISLEIV
jgi:nicotinate-nucleotide pyrophosphorylase (carboxylating)